MNRRQKLVQQRFLNNEEAVTEALEKTYEQALADVNKKIKNLQLDIDGIQGQLDVWEDFGGDEAEKEQLQSMLRSKVHQKRYQETIQAQLDDVLDKMHAESYNTVDAYLNGCYDEAYIGAFYDMHGQGVPIVAPIDQEAVTRAVQIDSKISKGLYSRLGEDVAGLKRTIASEVSRGIANGSTYAQVAQQISFKMVGAYDDRPGGALYRALTIARTEGGRIQSQAALDACYKAKDIGADVVKQWDSTLDGETRPSHRRVDGEIRELDEPFSNGLDYPRDPSGGAAEVVNCRCALLQRARWAVEGGFSKMNNFTKEIETFESPEDYEEFKKAFWSKENQDFMKHHTSLENKYGTKDFKKLLESMDDKEYTRYMKLYGNSPIYNKAAKATVKKDPYEGLTVEQKKDLISANSAKMLELSKQKGEAELAMLTASSDEDIAKYYNEARTIQKQLDDIAAENKVIQKQIDEMNAEVEKLKSAALKERAKNHRSVNGSDLSGKIDYSNTENGLDIETALHAQGFDGVPKVVEYDEFVEAMNKSNFYAERTYAASSQEVLDAYRDELYNGKWYVDCSEGGSQYGKGMYCAASYDVTDAKSMGGIGWEMSHYQKLGVEKGNSFAYTEAITLEPDARIFELPHNVKTGEYIPDQYTNHYLLTHTTGTEHTAVEEFIEARKKVEEAYATRQLDNINSLYDAEDTARAKIPKELFKEADEAMKYYPEGFEKYGKYKDEGTLVAEMGYDAINAVGHGESGSYTVILNRTKVIFCKGGSIYGN